MLAFINSMQHVRYILRRDGGVINASNDLGVTCAFEKASTDHVPYTVAVFSAQSSISIDDNDLSQHSDKSSETFIIGYPDKVYLSYRNTNTNKGTDLVTINQSTMAATCLFPHIAQYIEILMLQGMSNTAIIDRLVERLGLDRRHFRVYDVNGYKKPNVRPAALPYYKVQGYVKPRRKVTVGEY